MIKHCVICGAPFEDPPSNNRSTCSPECSSIWRGQRHLGLRFHKSEVARDKARAAAAKTGNLTHGTAAALKLPEGQRGPQNREAKIWHLRDPEGNPVVVVNLLDWARQHTQDFGMEPTDAAAANIASGFHQIKRSMEGKIRRNGKVCTVSSYKGWTLVAWEEKDGSKKRAAPKQSAVKEAKMDPADVIPADVLNRLMDGLRDVVIRCPECGEWFVKKTSSTRFCKSCAEERKLAYARNYARERAEVRKQAEKPVRSPEAIEAVKRYQAEYYRKNKDRIQAQRKAKKEKDGSKEGGDG